jgi:PrcB C-terminal
MDYRLPVVAAAALLAAATASAPAIPPPEPVPFRTVAQSDGAASAIGQRKSLTVRSERRWRRIWGRLTRGEVPSPRPSKIDFGRHMLIVVTQGRQPSGGHSIEIERIRRTGSGWRVEVEEVEPGRDCVTTGVITAPYHVVRVKRKRQNPSFAREQFAVACG